MYFVQNQITYLYLILNKYRYLVQITPSYEIYFILNLGYVFCVLWNKELVIYEKKHLLLFFDLGRHQFLMIFMRSITTKDISV